MTAVIAYAGNCIYLGQDKAWTAASNPEKLPAYAAETVQIVRAHTEDGERIRLCAPMIPASYIRQIDAAIEMPYGRLLTTVPPEYNLTERLYYAMEGNPEYREALGVLLGVHECNFVMTDDEKEFDSILLMDGFERIGRSSHYTIWKKTE